MRIDRARADDQPLCDFGIGQTVGEQLQHLNFARGQVGGKARRRCSVMFYGSNAALRFNHCLLAGQRMPCAPHVLEYRVVQAGTHGSEVAFIGGLVGWVEHRANRVT